MSGADPGPPAKQAVRAEILATRARRSAAVQRLDAERLRDRLLDLPHVQTASTVAAYRSLPGEPGTEPLVAALLAARVTVLLPILRRDRSLRWERAGAEGFDAPESAGRAGDEVLRAATVVVCPGLAGDRLGHRLGRGGGSYDRALATLPRGASLRCLLLYDDEVLDEIPTQPHDQPVDVLLTPTRTLRVCR